VEQMVVAILQLTESFELLNFFSQGPEHPQHQVSRFDQSTSVELYSFLANRMFVICEDSGYAAPSDWENLFQSMNGSERPQTIEKP